MKNKLRITIGAGLLIMALLLGAVGSAYSAYAAPNTNPAAQEEPREPGLVIVSVLADGPAAQAGVKRGDILLTVNDVEVNTVTDLQQILGDLQAETEVTLTVLHGDDERTLTVMLGEEGGRAFLGIVPYGDYVIEQMSDSAEGFEFEIPAVPRSRAEPFTLHFDTGVRIIEVVPDGPAAQAGLMQGDIVDAVDGQSVDQENDLATLIQSYQPGDTVTLDVRRGGTVTIGGTVPPPDASEGQAPESDQEGAEEESAEGEESAQEDSLDLRKHFTIEAQIEQIEVTLGAHPDDAEQAYLGVRFAPIILPGLQDRMRIIPGRPFAIPRPAVPGEETTQGAVIIAIEENSPAASAGLVEEDLITAVDGEAIESPRALVETIEEHEPGDAITLTVQSSDDAPRAVTVTLGEGDDGGAYLGVSVGALFRIRMFQGDDAAPGYYQWQFRPRHRDGQYRFFARPYLRGLPGEHFRWFGGEGQPDMTGPRIFRFESAPMRLQPDLEFLFTPGELMPEGACGTGPCESNVI